MNCEGIDPRAAAPGDWTDYDAEEAPRWTSTPPTELPGFRQGFYWWRISESSMMKPFYLPQRYRPTGGHWWTTRIPEPEEKKT